MCVGRAAAEDEVTPPVRLRSAGRGGQGWVLRWVGGGGMVRGHMHEWDGQLREYLFREGGITGHEGADGH